MSDNHWHDYPIEDHSLDELPDWALHTQTSMISHSLATGSPKAIQRLEERLPYPGHVLTASGDVSTDKVPVVSEQPTVEIGPFGPGGIYSLMDHDGPVSDSEDESDSDDDFMEADSDSGVSEAKQVEAVLNEISSNNDDSSNATSVTLVDSDSDSSSDESEAESSRDDDEYNDEGDADDDEDFVPKGRARGRATRPTTRTRRRPPLSPVKPSDNVQTQRGQKRARSLSVAPLKRQRPRMVRTAGNGLHISAAEAADLLRKQYQVTQEAKNAPEVISHHVLSDDRVQCGVCSDTILEDWGSWVRHSYRHITDWASSLCLACGKHFVRQDVLTRHMKASHAKACRSDNHVKTCCKGLHQRRTELAGLEINYRLEADNMTDVRLEQAVNILVSLQ
ncbi:hypothetical protein HDZ31DRAFT_50394 [Schizophyllum fasciatum]